MQMSGINYIATALFLGTAVLFSSGCAVIDQRALQPVDWVDQSIETFAVSGTGGWSRLRNKPVVIGPYTAKLLAKSPWGTLPTSTTSNTTMVIGSTEDDGGHELRDGTSSTNRDAELAFHLSDPSGELSKIRCRQVLQVNYDQTSVTGKGGTNVFSVSDLQNYVSSLNCQSSQPTASWPRWLIAMNRNEPKPLKGKLIVNESKYSIIGSQSSNIGHAPMTVSYEIRNGNITLALIDRSGNGQVSILGQADTRLKAALMGAAVALLLANDPMQPGDG